MENRLSPTAKSILNKDGLESQEPDPLVLRIPVDVYSFSLALLAVLAVIFVLQWARAIFIPLMLGVMISYALSPPVNLMQKWRIPRAIGAAVLLLGIVGGTGSLGYSLSDDAAKLIETLPDAAQKIRLARLKERGTSEGTMENVQKTATQLERAASETGAPAPAVPRGVTRVQIEKPKLNVKDYLWMGTNECSRICRPAHNGIVSGVFYAGFWRHFPAQTGQDQRPHPQQEKNHSPGAG